MADLPVPSATSPDLNRSRGRALFWLGIGAFLLGVVLCVAQYSLKVLIVPWYLPALATLGVLLLVASVAQRRSFIRIVVLGLLAALAAGEWYFLAAHVRLPVYRGPARAGRTVPAFGTTLADGGPFTEKDLQTGTPTVLVFFRGRW